MTRAMKSPFYVYIDKKSNKWVGYFKKRKPSQIASALTVNVPLDSYTALRQPQDHPKSQVPYLNTPTSMVDHQMPVIMDTIG